jgi:hypothetical protein
MAKRKKKKSGAGSFTRKLQRTPKVRSVRSKIKKQKAVLKRLSGVYRRTLTKESRRLSKKYR